jgi:hypothetical protein
VGHWGRDWGRAPGTIAARLTGGGRGRGAAAARRGRLQRPRPWRRIVAHPGALQTLGERGPSGRSRGALRAPWGPDRWRPGLLEAHGRGAPAGPGDPQRARPAAGRALSPG